MTEEKGKTVCWDADFTKRLSLSILNLQPRSKPSIPKKGDICFDKDSGSFVGYNGEEWVILDMTKLEG